MTMLGVLVVACIGLFELVALLAPDDGFAPYLYMIPLWAIPSGIWGWRIAAVFLLAHLVGFPLLRAVLPSSWRRRVSVRRNRIYLDDVEIMRLGRPDPRHRSSFED